MLNPFISSSAHPLFKALELFRRKRISLGNDGDDIDRVLRSSIREQDRWMSQAEDSGSPLRSDVRTDLQSTHGPDIQLRQPALESVRYKLYGSSKKVYEKKTLSPGSLLTYPCPVGAIK